MRRSSGTLILKFCLLVLFLLGVAHILYMYLKDGIQDRASLDFIENFYISGEVWVSGLSVSGKSFATSPSR